MSLTNNKLIAKEHINRLLMKMGIDGFVVLLVAMIFLAWLWPAPGAYDGAFNLGDIAEWGVSLIFFFYGLKLSPSKLKEDLSNWRLHVTIQVSTFLIFPLLIFLLMKLVPNVEDNLLWLGTFFLAALPSTVSSSVVMVSIARGNIPAAIFNASLSSLAGVFITPLWMEAVASPVDEHVALGSVFLKLTFQVLMPVVVGLMLHKRFGSFASRHREGLKRFDQSVILLIVYTSFCASFYNNMFDGYSFAEILMVTTAMAVLFFVIFFIVNFLSRLMRFSIEDRIAVVFCGTKKSLVHGTVMVKVLFPQSANVGVILLPLMIFHTIQLIIASIIAQKFDKRAKL